MKRISQSLTIILFGISTFFNPLAFLTLFTKNFVFYLRSRVFLEKSLVYYFQSVHIIFGTVVVNHWKTIFDIVIAFKIMILASSVFSLNILKPFNYFFLFQSFVLREANT